MEQDSKELIERMFEKGVLINKDLLEDEKENVEKEILDLINNEEDLLVLNEDYVDIICSQSSLIDWYDLDKYRVEKELDRNDDLYQDQLQNFKKSKMIIDTNDSKQVQNINSLAPA